ncbi:MAG: ATP-binding protein [Myxococcota bacterium]|nr:ATP-binding protein [Myxococcota bacterium]
MTRPTTIARLWALLDGDLELGPVERARARTLQLAAGVMIIGVVWSLLAIYMGLPFAGLFVIGISLMALVVVRETRRGHLDRAGHLTVLLVFAATISALFIRGGVQNSHPAWMLVVPLSAFAVLPGRWGFIWSGIVLAVVGAFWTGQHLGWIHVEPLDSDAVWLFNILDFVAILVVSTFFLWSFLEGRRGVLAELDARQIALEREVAERQHAEQVALEVVRARGSFLATMSHEIRTPLNGVLGMADVLLDGDLDTEQRELMEMLRGSGDLLRLLLNDILDLSKIDSGKMDLESVPVDLPGLCEQLLEGIRPQAREKGLQVTLDITPDAPRWIRSDPVRLRQIVGNLLSNALKFTAHGSITLRVRPEPQGLGIEVQDTGIGMSDQQLARVFRPFTQADSSTTRRFGGTGLGLSISQRLAQLMGGELSASSREGWGSTFQVILPLHACDAPSVTDEDIVGLTGLQGLRVLVAEDNVVNQVVISRMLERLDVEVHLASNGREAVAQWEALRPDLILMDCRMPELDGYDATRSIRAQGGQLPIIALTANNMAGDRQRSLEAGMDDHLGKPIEPQELTRCLARWSVDRAA